MLQWNVPNIVCESLNFSYTFVIFSRITHIFQIEIKYDGEVFFYVKRSLMEISVFVLQFQVY